MERQLSLFEFNKEKGMKKQRNVISQPQTVQVGILLEKHCIKISEDPKVCVYEDGYNDEIIARIADPSGKLTDLHVHRIRLQTHGSLRGARNSGEKKKQKAKREEELLAKIKELSDKVEALVAAFK